MPSEPSLIADLLERLDTERRYEFDERAGVIEFENGQPRDIAECLALLDLLRTYPGALLGITLLKVVWVDGTEVVITRDVEGARERLLKRGTCVLSIVDLSAVLSEAFDGTARVAEI